VVVNDCFLWQAAWCERSGAHPAKRTGTNFGTRAYRAVATRHEAPMTACAMSIVSVTPRTSTVTCTTGGLRGASERAAYYQ
jgi:hypothetical protein